MAAAEIRIIGGKWRGRKLAVLPLAGLRPTANRVRETLFNWLSPHIAHATCLDVFAGSGALGFEALSRGALKVVMADAATAVVALLRKEAHTLLAGDALQIHQVTAPEGLASLKNQYNILFLDPPYESNLLLPTAFYLSTENFLAAHALIFMEAPRVIKDNELPRDWQILKSQKAGQVYYYLAQFNGAVLSK